MVTHAKLFNRTVDEEVARLRQAFNQMNCPRDIPFTLCDQIVEFGHSLGNMDPANAKTYMQAIDTIIANPLSDRHTIALAIELAETLELFDIDCSIPPIMANDQYIHDALASFNRAAANNHDLQSKIFV